MGFIRELIGLALVAAAWFNPFAVDYYIQILMFIVGFDMMSLIPKVGVFMLDFFGVFGFFGLGWTLLILLAVEIISTFFLIGLFINLTIKPLAVFAVAFLALGSLNFAIIVGVVDLLLNLTRKFNL